MSTWFPGTAVIVDNGFGGDRGGYGVNGMIIHHTATTGDAFGYMANANDRDSHPTYHVIRGEARGIVNPNRRPYSTGHGVDAQCVTVEANNIEGAPDWTVGGDTVNTIAAIAAHHAREGGFTRCAPSIRGVDQAEFFIGWHSQYNATACPGPYLARHIEWICNLANEILNPPPVVPIIPPSYVWSAIGPVDMVALEAVNIIEIGTGAVLGTIAAGTIVTIAADIHVGSVRYLRSSWASERELNNGLDATKFTLPVAPEPEPTPEPEPEPTPDPIDVIVKGAVDSVPEPSDPTQIQYPGKAVIRTIVQTLVVLVPAANAIAAALNEYLVSQELAAISPIAFLILNGVIVVTGLIIGGVAKIMSIPGVNSWLTKLGLGATPADTAKHAIGIGKHRA